MPKGHRYQVEIPLDFGAPGKGLAARSGKTGKTGAPGQPEKMVYFDGRAVKKLPGKYQGGKFIAELDLGDPPLGRTTG